MWLAAEVRAGWKASFLPPQSQEVESRGPSVYKRGPTLSICFLRSSWKPRPFLGGFLSNTLSHTHTRAQTGFIRVSKNQHQLINSHTLVQFKRLKVVALSYFWSAVSSLFLYPVYICFPFTLLFVLMTANLCHHKCHVMNEPCCRRSLQVTLWKAIVLVTVRFCQHVTV